MDLVKIGFIVTADGIKNANNQVDQLLTKVEKVGNTPINIKAKIDSSITSAQKTLKDFSKFKNNVTVNISANGNAIKNLQNQLSRLKDRTIRLNVKASSQELGKLNQSLNQLTNKKVNIEIKITPSLQVLQDYNKELEKMRSGSRTTTINTPRPSTSGGRSSSNFDQAIGIAKYAVLSAAIYGAMTATLNLIKATITLADEYTATQQRLKLYIKDSETLGQVNTFLAKSAIQNNVGLRENAALYAKLSPAMQRIGANTAATNQVVDAFGKSLRIGGATAMEAASATIQFAQAMASGKLAGDEFRAISEASPRFLKAIADGSGIAAEKLKEMSSAGALTTEVIARALVKEYHNLTKESESLGYTLEQGTNALKTGFMSLIGEFNEGAGTTKYLGALMAGMGVDMINTAESAKKSGEAFKEWVTSNSDNINKLVDAFQLLTTFLITRYVVAIALARVESMKLSYSTSALAAAQTAAMRSFVIGATAVTAFGRAAQAAFTFMGGWAGILLTIGGVAATYLLLRDNAAEATQKLVEQSKYVDITTEAYQRLNKEQQLNARSSVANDMNEVNKKLDEQANAVERVLKSYVMSRQFSGLGVDSGTKDVLNKVTKGVMSYDTALRLLSENKSVPKNIVEDFKKEKDIYDETAKSGVRYAEAAKIVGTSSALAGNQAQNATPLIAGLADKTEGLGDKAEIAGSKFSKFALDLKKAIQDSEDTYDFMVRFDLDEGFAKKLVDRVNQNLAPLQGKIDKHIEAVEKAQKEIDKLDNKDPSKKILQAQNDKNKAATEGLKKVLEDTKKAYAAADAPLVQQAQKRAERVSELSASRRKSDKESANSSKEATKNLEKFNDQLLESQTYYDILKRTNNLEVARIASQKEYISIYKGNLDVATQIAEMQEKTSKEESRQEYDKSLKSQIEQLTVIAGLTAEGADYETAKALAAAGFTNDSRGRLAAEKTLMNTLAGQSDALSDQIDDQEVLNKYLKDGMGIEEARFKVVLSRIAMLSKGKHTFNSVGETFELGMKELRAKKAIGDHEIKLNAIRRESKLLSEAIALGYEASSIAAVKLAAATQELGLSEAEIQLKQQDELDLLYENAKTRVKINSLLSGESETLRAVKEDYATISDFEAERVAQLRKSLELAESYANKMKEQKSNPLGDFSSVDFEVFGSFGNPFKEALDGLNSLISGSSKLDESLAIVAAQISELQAQAFVEDMFGNQSAVENITSQIEKQLGLEKDLQKQKAETNDIAYGKGLKFAKSFFKEESKGYKIINALEMALQAKKIAFKLWEKKDTISMLATKVAGYTKDAIAFVTGTATKIAAQIGLNVAQAQGAVAASANAPPPFGFASAAAMIALLAGIGIAIGGGGSSGSFAPTNEGTGTVFGDTEAQSSSIANSIDLLSENSDLMLPLTSAMLASLKNIESSIGGVTNLVIRNSVGSKLAGGVNQGFSPNTLGKALSNPTVGSLGGMIGGGALAATTGVSAIMGGLGMGAMGALAIAGPIGLAVGALLGPTLGKALGGLFGTKTTIKGQGLYGGSQDLGDILSQGYDLKEYVDIQTKKKAFGITTSTKNSTRYSDANQELENQFSLIFTGFYDSIVAASGALSADMDEVEKKLQDTVISIGKIDLKGLNGEQIQEKLEAVFGAAADNLAQQGFAGLDDFQKVGEGYYETLIRVASSVEQASYYTDRLNVSAIKYTDILNKQGDVAAEIVRQSVLLVEGNKNIKGGFYDLVNTFDGTADELSAFIVELRDLQDQLFMTGKNADYLTSSMILGAGGLDGLSSGLDAYFEMLSPAEQAAELTRRLTKEFAIFGKELPSDVKAFRNLVSGIDISTEAGQKLYGQIIALAPEFNDLQDSLKNANSEVNALVQSLRDLAEQARGARGETDQTRNLASVRNEFDRVSTLAMQGDIESATRLVDLGKELMGVSKNYAVSSEEYAKDLALIQRAATVAADIQANGLGTSTTPTLSPTTGTNTTPTVATTNTAMTTEMQTMREEFNAGLFAIAKYVQNLDSRTERWDDGNRVMIGVLAENGDTPLPVTTV